MFTVIHLACKIKVGNNKRKPDKVSTKSCVQEKS